jgi:hypothetical protein
MCCFLSSEFTCDPFGIVNFLQKPKPSGLRPAATNNTSLRDVLGRGNYGVNGGGVLLTAA